VSAKPPQTLASLKALAALDRESTHYWHAAVAVEYAARWLNTLTGPPEALHRYPGDNRDPFRRIPRTPDRFIAAGPANIEITRENTIVSFSGAFETYLFDAFERAVFLNPGFMSDSEIALNAKELAGSIGKISARAWFAQQAAAHYVRNKTHVAAIARLNKIAKLGLKPDDTRLLQWSHWELVRNSIIHTSRQTSADLVRAWRARFPAERKKLQLSDQDISDVSSLARSLISDLDKRLCSEVVKKEDGKLLVREYYVRWGWADPAAISSQVSKLLRCKLKTQEVEHQIALQKKGDEPIDGFDFHGLLDVITPPHLNT